MVMLPNRRSMRNRSLADPTREFEDIYQRMGELVVFQPAGEAW